MRTNILEQRWRKI